MARKINFDMTPPEPAAEPKPAAPNPIARPLLGLVTQSRQTGAMSAISKSIDGLTDKARRADEIEEKLIQGQTVVALDPALIDPSPVPDRMQQSDGDAEAFRETIRQSGQHSPILVRPHPKAPGRYEAAFGHRRLRAARELGIEVKAVVRQLSDEELIVAQGQENSARADLTFIERARFAVRLEANGYKRETIMQALAIDKAQLSKVIALATRIPAAVIDWIGPAPGFGRDRWTSLADLVATEEGRAKAITFAETNAGLAGASDKRFLALLDRLRNKAEPARAEPCMASDGTRIAVLKRSERTLSIQFDDRTAPQFGNFVRDRLEELYAAFREHGQTRSTAPSNGSLEKTPNRNEE